MDRVTAEIMLTASAAKDVTHRTAHLRFRPPRRTVEVTGSRRTALISKSRATRDSLYTDLLAIITQVECPRLLIRTANAIQLNIEKTIACPQIGSLCVFVGSKAKLKSVWS